MSTKTRETAAPELEPYREQARELEQALAKVKAIQEQTAAVTLQRESVLKKRQSLLDSWGRKRERGERGRAGQGREPGGNA